MNNKKWIAGILSAIAAGAILGVLLSPDSGKKTRKKILEKTDDLGDQLKSSFTGFVDRISEKIGKLSD
jgi:gas vesicle protein